VKGRSTGIQFIGVLFVVHPVREVIVRRTRKQKIHEPNTLQFRFSLSNNIRVRKIVEKILLKCVREWWEAKEIPWSAPNLRNNNLLIFYAIILHKPVKKTEQDDRWREEQNKYQYWREWAVVVGPCRGKKMNLESP